MNNTNKRNYLLLYLSCFLIGLSISIIYKRETYKQEQLPTLLEIHPRERSFRAENTYPEVNKA